MKQKVGFHAFWDVSIIQENELLSVKRKTDVYLFIWKLNKHLPYLKYAINSEIWNSPRSVFPSFEYERKVEINKCELMF